MFIFFCASTFPIVYANTKKCSVLHFSQELILCCFLYLFTSYWKSVMTLNNIFLILHVLRINIYHIFFYVVLLLYLVLLIFIIIFIIICPLILQQPWPCVPWQNFVQNLFSFLHLHVFEVLQSLQHLHLVCFPFTSKYALQASLQLSVVFYLMMCIWFPSSLDWGMALASPVPFPNFQSEWHPCCTLCTWCCLTLSKW